MADPSDPRMQPLQPALSNGSAAPSPAALGPVPGSGPDFGLGLAPGSDVAGAPPVVVPKMKSYQFSYATAHSEQKQAGRVKPATRRAPQSLPGSVAPSTAPGPADAPEAPKAPKRVVGRAVVRAVPSGDTIVLAGQAPAPGLPPLEKQLTLSGLSAPRISRGRNAQDEPFAWESREFLRTLCLGKVVDFEVNFTSQSGREYGKAQLGGKDLAQAIVEAGWATVLPGSAKKGGSLHPDRQALADLCTKAEEEGVGMHEKGLKKKQHTRKVNYDPASAAKLLARFKGQPLRAQVDRVREGSMIRVEVLSPDPSKPLQHTMINLFLAGVQTPRTFENMPGTVQHKPEPFSLHAKEFVAMRLLNREVDVVLQGTDKTNHVFGTLLHPKGNISVELIKNGLATYVPWSASWTDNAAELKSAEGAARAARLNIWRNALPVSDAKGVAKGGGFVTDKQFNAVVGAVQSGDTLVVEDASGATKRIMLASVRAPRGRNRNGEAEAWAVEAKEFLRKKLIGKKVRVSLEYTRPAPDSFADKSPMEFYSVWQGKANVCESLVNAGLAECTMHRVDEPRASNYQQLLQAETRAKEAKKGLHGQAPARKPMVDLTQRPRRAGPKEKRDERDDAQARQAVAKAKQFFTFLEKDRALRGVVEHVFSGSRLKVSCEKHNCVFFMVLAGIRCPRAPSANRSETGEPFGEAAMNLTRRLVQQRDVRLEVETMDRGGNVIGSVFAGTTNLALLLLQEGLAEVFGPSADRSKYCDQLYQAEQEAKTQKKGKWVNWVKPRVEEKKEETEGQEITGSQQLISVTVTEIMDAANFYVHIVGNQEVARIEEAMRTFTGPTVTAAFEPKKGQICAARFTDGSWYRVRVDSNKDADGLHIVTFIDYGNTEQVGQRDLSAITDPSIASAAPLARHCKLAGIKAPHVDHDYHDLASSTFNDMVWQKELIAKCLLRDRSGVLHMELLEKGSPLSINRQLLESGLARIVKKPDRRLAALAKDLQQHQQTAISKRVGLWEYGDVSDPEEEDFDKGGFRK